ncbi:MAG: metallophosphoesterase [Candidatus Aminicenantes bacterium]|nr:metallophosphoesterase [Candidatus Aminicenantes bacterium]
MKRTLIPVLLIFILIFTTYCNEPDKSESFSFVFMTDVHLKPENNAPEGFKKAIAKINSLEPAFVISGGDQIDDALEQSYERADLLFNMYSEIVKNLEMPIYNVLGNHDIFGIYKKSGIDPAHPLYGKKMFEKKLNKKQYSFDHKGWHFIILDSVQPAEGDSYTGEIDPQQMNWLKTHILVLNKKTPVVLATHVPFYTIMPQLDKRFKYEKFSISNSTDVLELFKDHNLKFVLQGHVHNYEAIFSNGIWFISGGAVSANWWEGQLHGMEEGFVEFHINGEEFTWQYIDYDWEVRNKNIE